MRPVAVQLALANTGGQVDANQVYAFLETADADLETYEPAPPPLGTIRAAAIDFALIIGTAGSIASIASLIWLAYDKFVAPHKGPNDSAGIVLWVRRDDRTSEQFWIGNLQEDEEVFVREFTATVKESRESSDGKHSTDEVITELRSREMWIRRK